MRSSGGEKGGGEGRGELGWQVRIIRIPRDTRRGSHVFASRRGGGGYNIVFFFFVILSGLLGDLYSGFRLEGGVSATTILLFPTKLCFQGEQCTVEGRQIIPQNRRVCANSTKNNFTYPDPTIFLGADLSP